MFAFRASDETGQCRIIHTDTQRVQQDGWFLSLHLGSLMGLRCESGDGMAYVRVAVSVGQMRQDERLMVPQ